MKLKKQIVRPKQLAQELNISTCTLWRWTKQSKIPQPIKLGPRLVGWRREVIDDWLDSQK
jgi:prophage regulatory protein